MGDRYRYPRARPRSPTFYDPAHASLPIIVGGGAYNSGGYSSPMRSEHHLHVIPTRREVIPPPRSSSSSVTTGPVITTTYKVSDAAPRVREGSRTRRSTLESNVRPVAIPTIITATPRHKPVVHSAGGRQGSPPMKDPYRSSQEEYYSVPGTSRHKHHHHKSHSATLDATDMSRLAREREAPRLQPGGPREVGYRGQRTQQRYSGSARHPDVVGDDYGDNGYGYTNPRELVTYDLNKEAPRHRRRRDSSVEQVGGRARPNSITGYNDIVPRSYDGRERGPPPTTRGFDRIPTRAPAEWDQPRMSVPYMDPIQRPASVERSRPESSYEPELQRRNSSRRPVSVYHDREPRRSQREDYYEAREEDPRRRSERSQRHERYDDGPEHRGSRSDRPERVEKRDDDKKDHKTRDVLTTGLSLAGAALGVKAFKDVTEKEDPKEDRIDERDEREPPRRRRDYDDDPRQRRDPRDDLEPEQRENRLEKRSSRDDRERGPPEQFIDLSSRNPSERVREDRDSDPERLRRRPEVSTSEVAVDSHEGSVASDEATTPRRRRRESAAAFNPKDTMDLVALKAALNSKEAATPKDAAPARTPTRTPRESISRSSQELVRVRDDMNDDSRALRIVTPPLPAGDKAPVKGILRQPREKFPEDPAPIREGVAPLKDAKKDGVPPDARWTKISRKLVNPEALEAGKERYEAREDFVIVLRVLSRDEVQGYAEVTERIRAAREELEEQEERDARRRARRERHERHKRERLAGERGEKSKKRKESESDTTDDDEVPKMLEGPMMSGGLGIAPSTVTAGSR